MVLYLFNQVITCLISRGKNNKSLYNFAPGFIRTRYHCGLCNSRMLDQCAFNFKGTDSVAGSQNNIIGSSDKPEIAVFIHICPVSGQVPVATVNRCSPVRLFPVFLKQPNWSFRFNTDGNISFCIGRQYSSILINDFKVDTGSRFSHGSVARLNTWKTAAEQYGFSLTISVPYYTARSLFPYFNDFRVQWLTGTHTVSKAWKLVFT